VVLAGARIVVELTLDTAQWAQQNFGGCELGNAFRTRRAVRLAQQMAEHPDGSTPDQTENWADLKGCYRLLACKDVTFEQLAKPHWKLTLTQARGVVLLIGDTTETDFGLKRSVAGLGPTGDGGGRGFLLHSSMMVDPQTRRILGLAGQELFYRQPKPQGENSYQASQREGRESEVWGRLINQIGSPAEGVRYVHTFDRGADNVDVFCHLLHQRSDWVIRAAQLHRTVREETAAGRAEPCQLSDVLARQPVLGTYELKVRAVENEPARTARLEVRAARVTIPARKKRPSAVQRKLGIEEITQWVVEAREVSPPKGATPVRWVLWTSLPVASFEDAWQILGYYELRWLIEEFHKALKTGCRLEHRQYQTAHSLEALAGLSSVLAVRLVQLKTVAQTAPETPARGVVPKIWLDLLQVLRKRTITTVKEFFRHLAGLGGFLMRKRDGDPGWITLWKGLDKLLLAIRGYLGMKQKGG